jgi:hypothetical protein
VACKEGLWKETFGMLKIAKRKASSALYHARIAQASPCSLWPTHFLSHIASLESKRDCRREQGKAFCKQEYEIDFFQLP